MPKAIVFYIVLTLIGIVLFSAPGAEQRNRYELTEIRVHDGDTFKVDIDLGLGVILNDQDIRCLGYDAWEVTKTRRTVVVTDEEIRKGKLARDAVKDHINGKSVTGEFEWPSKDPYGRLQAYVFVNGKPLADWMETNGHTR